MRPEIAKRLDEPWNREMNLRRRRPSLGWVRCVAFGSLPWMLGACCSRPAIPVAAGKGELECAETMPVQRAKPQTLSLGETKLGSASASVSLEESHGVIEVQVVLATRGYRDADTPPTSPGLRVTLLAADGRSCPGSGSPRWLCSFGANWVTYDAYGFTFRSTLAAVLGGSVKVTFGRAEQVFPVPKRGKGTGYFSGEHGL